MKAILASAAVLLICAADAAAQNPSPFAYDQCVANPDWAEIDCYVGTYIGGANSVGPRGYAPHWSPDGTKLVYYESNYGYIAVLSLETGNETVLTERYGNWNEYPAWTPDGRIVFLSYRDGLAEFYVMDGDGTNQTRITNHAGALGYVHSWALSPDGTEIAFEVSHNSEYELAIIHTDGTGLRYLTNQFANRPAWSADSQRLAFECASALRNDICVMNADGTGFQKLTSDPTNDINDTEPAWSPNGTIAFTTEMFGSGSEIALIDGVGGGGITRLAPGVGGVHAVWSPDGMQLLFTGTTPSYYTGICYGGDDDFCFPVYPIYVINADGSGLAHLTDGDNPDWRPAAPATPVKPIASFAGQCSGTACTFDASASYGVIDSYSWQFGDGASGAGSTASHTYGTGATYSVTLTVVGPGGTDTATKSFAANTPPVASFTSACNGLTCTFNASASSDVDGTAVAYTWYFGDGTATGPTPARTYSMPGQKSVTLVVTDSAGATGSTTHTIQVDGSMHIGDLDRSTTSFQNSWGAAATIEVHDGAHQPVPYVTVTGVWNDGSTDSCGTGSDGRCSIGRPSLPKKTTSVTFTIQSVTRYMFTYTPSANHDPDGDSNGTKIVITR